MSRKKLSFNDKRLRVQNYYSIDELEMTQIGCRFPIRSIFTSRANPFLKIDPTTLRNGNGIGFYSYQLSECTLWLNEFLFDTQRSITLPSTKKLNQRQIRKIYLNLLQRM